MLIVAHVHTTSSS